MQRALGLKESGGKLETQDDICSSSGNSKKSEANLRTLTGLQQVWGLEEAGGELKALDGVCSRRIDSKKPGR